MDPSVLTQGGLGRKQCFGLSFSGWLERYATFTRTQAFDEHVTQDDEDSSRRVRFGDQRGGARAVFLHRTLRPMSAVRDQPCLQTLPQMPEHVFNIVTGTLH